MKKILFILTIAFIASCKGNEDPKPQTEVVTPSKDTVLVYTFHGGMIQSLPTYSHISILYQVFDSTGVTNIASWDTVADYSNNPMTINLPLKGIPSSGKYIFKSYMTYSRINPDASGVEDSVTVKQNIQFANVGNYVTPQLGSMDFDLTY